VSATGLLVLGTWALGLVLALRYSPIFAIFSYLLVFYNHPPAHWWGEGLPDLRYSLVAAVIALVAVWIHKTGVGVAWAKNGAAKLLTLYAVWAWIQMPWALSLPLHLEGCILFTKFVVLFYVIHKTTVDEEKFEWFLMAHVVGCFMFGWMAYTSNSGGRLETIGGPGVDDANLLAAHVATGLVVAGFLFLGLKGWRRWMMFAALPFIMNTIILTQSRGGLITLLAAGVSAWYLAPRGSRRWVSISGGLAVVLFLMLANDEFWSRMSTLTEGDESGAHETRAQILGPQFRMFLDHPMGTGHRGNLLLSPQYMPPELLSNSGYRSAHNTFMAALVDQGAPGALILLGIYGWMLITLVRLKRLDARGLPYKLGIYRAAVGSSLVSCIVAGLFLNLIKFEALIWFVALLASLVVLCEKSCAHAQKIEVPDHRRQHCA
jgi:hypothetical protein